MDSIRNFPLNAGIQALENNGKIVSLAFLKFRALTRNQNPKANIDHFLDNIGFRYVMQ